MVSQPKQIFHCFGCGAGGDVVSFLMKHESLSFNEAVQVFAKKAGIEIGEFAFDKDRSERSGKAAHNGKQRNILSRTSRIQRQPGRISRKEELKRFLFRVFPSAMLPIKETAS